MIWLVIYDIRDEKRLARIAKLVEQYGVRVQKSVFEIECDIKTMGELRSRAKEILENEDSFIAISLCEKCWQRKVQYGVKEIGVGEFQSYRIL